MIAVTQITLVQTGPVRLLNPDSFEGSRSHLADAGTPKGDAKFWSSLDWLLGPRSIGRKCIANGSRLL